MGGADVSVVDEHEHEDGVRGVGSPEADVVEAAGVSRTVTGRPAQGGVTRSNAFTIAAVRRGSQLAGSTPIRRIRADFGTVRMLSVLMAESTLSPVAGPESMLTSVGMPRICDVMGAIVTQARRLTMC